MMQWIKNSITVLKTRRLSFMDDVRRNVSVLEHMQRYCAEIKEMVNRFGDSLDDFKSDYAYRHACAMCILQIGELTTHLTDDFKQAYDKLPWKSMKAMRNVAVHKYGRMSIENMWDTMKQDIPILNDYCAEILIQYNLCSQPAVEIEYEDETDEGID
jgi:uncharacterized protein with HEPN domain